MIQVEEINHAFLHQLRIEVWQHGEKIGAGIITKHTKADVVLDDGMHYLKSACEFRISK